MRYYAAAAAAAATAADVHVDGMSCKKQLHAGNYSLIPPTYLHKNHQLFDRHLIAGRDELEAVESLIIARNSTNISSNPQITGTAHIRLHKNQATNTLFHSCNTTRETRVIVFQLCSKEPIERAMVRSMTRPIHFY
jgi:hypothetical protein